MVSLMFFLLHTFFLSYVGHVVFEGLVARTEKMTKTGLNPTQPNATRPLVAVAQFWALVRLPVALFWEMSKAQENQLQLVANSFLTVI